MNIDLNHYSGITCDSRKVKPEFIFTAIEGLHEDGHHYIGQAIQKGASLIITEKPHLSWSVPFVQVSNARKVLAELTSEFYGHPSQKINITGITGTNGKTTTTHMLHSIFREAERNTGVIGTTGIYMNDQYEPSMLTTPDTESLQKSLHTMVDRNLSHVFMEVSSHGLSQERVHHIDFDTAVFTNISKDHLDIHTSFDEYLYTKSKLFNSLNEKTLAIVNKDDPYADQIIQHCNSCEILGFGIRRAAESIAKQISFTNGISFIYQLKIPIMTKSTVVLQPFSMAIHIPIYGLHNVYNALAAITAALYNDIPKEIVKKGLEKFTGVFRRFQWLDYKPYRIIDDFCHNPSGYEAVFNTLQHISYDRLFIVNAIRGNRGTQINQENAQIVGQWIHKLNPAKLFLTSSEDVVKPKDQVSDEERSVFFQSIRSHGGSFEHYFTLQEALQTVLSQANTRDLILLCGAQGMDPAQSLFTELKKSVPI